jgi:hypothetical protein
MHTCLSNLVVLWHILLALVIRDLHILPTAGINITQIVYCFKKDKDNLEENV